jgi:hypothetical protein
MVSKSHRDTRLLYRFATLRSVMAMAVTSLLAVGLILGPSLVTGLPIMTITVATAFQAVGASLVASVMIYAFFSIFVEPVRMRAQARETTNQAIDLANEQFQQRFAISLPTAVYESSSFLKPDFRRDFVDALSGSTRYDYKGTSAVFTSFRMHRLRHRSEFRRLDQIRICMLDPTNADALEANARHYLEQRGRPSGNQDTLLEMQRMRDETYVSIFTLHGASDALTIRLYFHQDLPYLRCEGFDGGLFLTYYLGRERFPQTLLYSRQTHTFDAYSANLDLTRKYARKAFTFAPSSPSSNWVRSEQELETMLSSLGCTKSLMVLKRERDDRFKRLSSSLRSARISRGELF